MSIRDKLYRISATLFEQKGYPGTSIRDIAEAMGLKPSSLYSHIRNKDEILISICDTMATAYEKGLNGILSSDVEPLEKLEAIIDFHVQMAFEHAISITVFNDEWQHLPEPHLSDFLRRRKRYEGQLLELLSQMKQKGHLKPIPDDFIAQTILSSLVWLHKRSYKSKPGNLADYQKWMKAYILQGILSEL